VEAKVDHIAVAFDESYVDAAEALEIMGFEQTWHREYIGNEQSGMRTEVLQMGNVEFAIMEGVPRTKRSQISDYTDKFGEGVVQHIALHITGLPEYVEYLKSNGVQFLTPILSSKDQSGILLQTFTYPIVRGGKFFFELCERLPSNAGLEGIVSVFADKNVKGLWQYLEEAIDQGWWWRVNLFGEED